MPQSSQEGQCCQDCSPALVFLPKQQIPGEMKAGGAPENWDRVQEVPGEQAALEGLTFHCRVKHLLENWSIPGRVCDRVFLIYDLALFCSLASLRLWRRVRSRCSRRSTSSCPSCGSRHPRGSVLSQVKHLPHLLLNYNIHRIICPALPAGCRDTGTCGRAVFLFCAVSFHPWVSNQRLDKDLPGVLLPRSAFRISYMILG